MLKSVGRIAARWLRLDTRITSNCRAAGAGSYAVISAAGTAPDLCMKAPRGIDWGFFPSALVHELGHAFGMDDTYTRRNLVSTGGLARTMGKQPSSMMSGGFPLPSMFQLGEDDKNGIIWLYRYLHEGHPAGDCFFPDYVPAGHDGNCRPSIRSCLRYGTVVSTRRSRYCAMTQPSTTTHEIQVATPPCTTRCSAVKSR